MNDEILQIISNETKDTIKNIEVVTPTIYTSVFQKSAKLHDEECKDELAVTNHLLDEKLEKYLTLQDQASNSATKLGDSTNKAITAMHNKNENLLNQVLQETKDLKAEIEKLKKSVYKDELTNVHNRKWLYDNYIDKGTDSLNSNGVLALIDINYFKEVNDTFGHVIGDKVLIYLVQQLRKSKNDIVRYGGDEFLILFSNHSSIKTAMSILEKIRDNVISKKLQVHKDIFRVSFSFGLYPYKNGDLLNQIIQEADIKMYHDKVNIKKRVTGIH